MTASLLRTAFELKRAIDNAKSITPIGHCVSAEEDWKHNNSDEEEEEEEEKEPCGPATKRQALVHMSAELRDMVSKYSCSVSIDEDFENESQFAHTGSCVVITRPGCELSGDVTNIGHPNDDYLQRWHEHANVSPYGDQKTLETKVDASVRSAKEITSEHFTVTPELLSRVQELWSKNFWQTNVVAKPYKINIYGPGDHFKPHKDTPEKDLVGTFLIGLGDTSDGKLTFENTRWGSRWECAGRGSWTAFFPSVTHEIKPLTKGYRATLALKIYRQGEKCSGRTDGRQDLVQLFQGFTKPFGVLFDHQYCIDTDELSGIDSLMLKTLRQLPGATTHLLPVVTTFSGSRWSRISSYDDESTSSVHPLTEYHINQLLGKPHTKAAKKEAEWVGALDSSVPFFSLNKLGVDGFVWEHHRERAAEHTGNESRPESEDSIYLHYAAVVTEKQQDITHIPTSMQCQ
jgi:hypothetical protein